MASKEHDDRMNRQVFLVEVLPTTAPAPLGPGIVQWMDSLGCIGCGQLPRCASSDFCVDCIDAGSREVE